MSEIISPKGSQGHDIRQPLQVAAFRRPDHLAVRALVSALLPQLKVDHTTIYRWVQRYAPELEKRYQTSVSVAVDSPVSILLLSSIKGNICLFCNLAGNS